MVCKRCLKEALTWNKVVSKSLKMHENGMPPPLM